MNIYQAKCFSKLLILIGTCPRRGRVGIYARLARRLKLKSPRTIAMVVKKQRPPSAGLVKLILESQNFSAMEQDYIQLLAEKSRRELKGEVSILIEEKIQQYQNIQYIEVTPKMNIGGVSIEISPDANAQVTRKILECLKEILAEKKHK